MRAEVVFSEFVGAAGAVTGNATIVAAAMDLVSMDLVPGRHQVGTKSGWSSSPDTAMARDGAGGTVQNRATNEAGVGENRATASRPISPNGALLRRPRHPELEPKAQVPVDAQGLEADRPEPTSDRPGSGPDRPELTADRPESEADRPELPPDLAPSVMVAEGLRRLFPDEPTHPNQAYAAPLGNDEKGPT